jgi:predicted ATPase
VLRLHITNFKCFQEADIPLNQLTVFAGANGNGKSTAIQALLFLRRTIEHCAKWDTNHYNVDDLAALNVELNGPYCLNLGNSGCILPINSDSDKICLGISDGDNIFSLDYSTNNGNELWLTPVKPVRNNYTGNPLCYQEFYYLNAERIGPRLSQEVKFYDYYNVGHKGEYTAQIISNFNSIFNYNFKADEKRVNQENLKGKRFEHHVNAWLNFILPGVSIVPHYDDKTHTACIEVDNGYSRGNPVVSTNTGFGISYVLPVIVSGLIAHEDRLLIVENPEAHLHPSAQSKIGYFLGVIANAGVRVITETHSDHVINGIQIAVAKKVISHHAVTINFFNMSGDNDSGSGGIQPEIISIPVKEKGELTEWPRGFFDQSQIDYSCLIGLRKNV